ncbi:uncharacterized protein LOC124942879 [Impatiens glandulifera]|uniref:uncharacterized protein LOC124942879 n=1 Tax=Impatiens glandulifera TaxID=253017 RepID=UPI001FB0F423|nr:uncharacterized protein LOC124942879 [Impatiens glandulifera]XP_047339406.1 uncharacterized protein LOC124942879 [Impatiens glandulifera]
MSSKTSRVAFRTVIVVFIILALFYIGRPLYWKVTATVQDIRQKKQTVTQGLSQIVHEARKSVGWFHDEFDSGAAANRKLLRFT